MSSDLDPLDPPEAIRLYLDARRDDTTENTREGQLYRLRAFAEWCEEEGIENLNDLDGRDLYAYRIWRRDGGYSNGGELAASTLRGDLATLRAFLRFCGEIDAVPTDLFDRVPLPSVSGQDVSDSTLDPERAESIVDYLGEYQYASRTHIIVLLLWHTGCRTGALRALDVDDLDLDGTRPNAEGPGIHFVHRPDEGTPLKNKSNSQRWNSVSEYVADALRGYLRNNRDDTQDEHGRNPLISTYNGRMSRSAIREVIYRVTRPCWYGQECPHDEDPDSCEFTEAGHMSKCPSARSPHDLRSGRLTYYRLHETDRTVVSDRMDASDDILDKHYDRRSERRKAEQRRTHLPE
ncbi:site-specific integrase [Halosegnis longus]|uniref:site-specific integrase n=1 Tax=Halosegnis longus TaxID=2216012 RepID=UPI00096A978C|nr:tyrosine-type recombinase/integrase [Salella cibi]